MNQGVMTNDLLEAIGSLVASLKAYASKLPAVVHLSVVPGGLKPKPEAVEAYEHAVDRFRDRTGASVYRRFTERFIESLEAFEAGKLFGAVQPLLTVLDHLDVMQRDKEITLTPAEEKRLAEYRTALMKILPGNQPELEGAGRGL
jgi:hypothetical protein